MADLGEVDVFELITNLCFSELFIVKAAPDNTSTIINYYYRALKGT